MTFNTISEMYKSLLKRIEKNTSKNNVFGDEIVVIAPNDNVANLLKMKLADKRGVVARITFLTKEQFVNLKIKTHQNKYLGFKQNYLRYHILNILDDPRINSNISMYYKDDFMKKYNYAKDLEESFVHYQNNLSSLLEEFNNYKLDNQIKNVYELQVLIYQSVKGLGFIPLNKIVENVIGTNENIHLIYDGNESELFNNLIKKFTNISTYKLNLNRVIKPIKLLNNWSKIREMETVWDYITNTIENTSLLPSDILVLFPNVEEYSTAINYVFSKNIINQSKYQYSISNFVNEVEVYQQFLSRLRVETDYRLEADKIFDLFNLSVKIKEKDYDKLELTLIKDWIMNNGIRREQSRNCESYDFNWEKGFEQLILGMMMRSDSFNHLGEYVSKDISFSEYEIFEDLYMFVETIKKLSTTNYTTLEQLNDLMLESLLVFFGESENEDSILNKVINLWLEIVNKQLVILNDLPPIKVALKILQEEVKLFNLAHLNSGGINFGNIEDFNLFDSKLKIVCGLDDNSFPQIKIESDLNLDKNKEKNNIIQQQTLFENLIYNDTEVVLSYIGFNESNRKTINRSVLIYILIKDKLVEINHKLHPFDKVYIQESNEYYYTYDSRYKAYERLSSKTPFISKDYIEEGIYRNLNDLKRITRSPVRNWFRNILRVSFPEDEELLKNSPLYFLETENKLEYAIIKRAILEDYNNQSDDEIKKLKAQGVIPYDSFGKLYVDEYKTLYNQIVKIFNDEETYEFIENLNIVYGSYFLNVPQIYYNKKEDNYLIITAATINKEHKKRSKETHYDFRTIFLNYLFEALLIKLAYNKEVKLVGFNKENELIIYDKSILEILNINEEDGHQKIKLLEEKLDYFWSLKKTLSTNLYLFDLRTTFSQSPKEDEKLSFVEKAIKGVFESNSDNVKILINNFKEFETILSIEESARKDYLKEETGFDEEEIKEVLTISKTIEDALKSYIQSFGNHLYGIKKYDVYIQYLLNDIYSVEAFIEKYGLMPLLESYLFCYDVSVSANFNIKMEEDS